MSWKRNSVNTNTGDIHEEYPHYSVYLNEIAEGPSSLACCAWKKKSVRNAELRCDRSLRVISSLLSSSTLPSIYFPHPPTYNSSLFQSTGVKICLAWPFSLLHFKDLGESLATLCQQKLAWEESSFCLPASLASAV